MKFRLGLTALLATIGLALPSRADEPPPPPPPLSPAEEAVTAAEHAAEAAAEAARAASDAAKAAAKLVGVPAPEVPKPAEPPKPPPPPPLSGTISLGLISLTGNAESLTASAGAAIDYKTTDWIYSLRGSAKYGQSRAVDASTVEILALAASLALRVDRRFSERYQGYLLAGGDLDHVKSVLFRGTGEGGISVIWLDDKEGELQKRYLRSDLALRGARELRYQFFPTRVDVPDVTIVAPRLGISFRYAMNEFVSFVQDVEVITNVYGDIRNLVNTLTKLQARLTKTFAISAGFELHYDSRPAQGRVPTDTTLTLGLDVKL